MEHTKSGLGLQQTFGDYEDDHWPTSFAVHDKRPLMGERKKEVDYCRRVRGCDASYRTSNQVGGDGSFSNNETTFEIGCHHNRTALAASRR